MTTCEHGVDLTIRACLVCERPLTTRDELAFRLWMAECADMALLRRVSRDEAEMPTWQKNEIHEIAARLLPAAYEYADAFLAERDRQMVTK